MPYRAPASEFRFLFEHVVPLAEVAATERFAEATPETVDAILAEAGRLCEEVLAPLQRVGDVQGSWLENGVVRTPERLRRGVPPDRRGRLGRHQPHRPSTAGWACRCW